MTHHFLLYLCEEPWSKSGFADLCTSTPTDLWTKVRVEAQKFTSLLKEYESEMKE